MKISKKFVKSFFNKNYIFLLYLLIFIIILFIKPLFLLLFFIMLDFLKAIIKEYYNIDITIDFILIGIIILSNIYGFIYGLIMSIFPLLNRLILGKFKQEYFIQIILLIIISVSYRLYLVAFWRKGEQIGTSPKRTELLQKEKLPKVTKKGMEKIGEKISGNSTNRIVS